MRWLGQIWGWIRNLGRDPEWKESIKIDPDFQVPDKIEAPTDYEAKAAIIQTCWTTGKMVVGHRDDQDDLHIRLIGRKEEEV